MKCGPDECPIVAFSDLTPAEQRVERKRAAEKMAKQGFTEAQIAKQLGVSQQTISNDLSNLPTTGKSKPAKTKSNPKGAGRPKGRKERPHKNDPTTKKQAAELFLDEGLSREKIKAQTGLGEHEVQLAVERERGRREAQADPEIDRTALSMSAQQKLDAAIRQHKRELEKSFRAAVQKEVAEWGAAILPKLHAELAQARKREQAVCNRKFISKEDFNTIRRCLHPDSRNSLSDAMLAKAFNKFQELEKYLLDAVDAPTSFTRLPETMAEWDKMRAKATAARKAKRANGKQTISP